MPFSKLSGFVPAVRHGQAIRDYAVTSFAFCPLKFQRNFEDQVPEILRISRGPPAVRLRSPEPKGDFDYTLLRVVVKWKMAKIIIA
jgi:hypothetical protein